MAAFGCTVLLRMMSEISRFKAMSSLELSAAAAWGGEDDTYRLEEVAFSTCSSKLEFEAPNHDAILVVLMSRGEVGEVVRNGGGPEL